MYEKSVPSVLSNNQRNKLEKLIVGSIWSTSKDMSSYSKHLFGNVSSCTYFLQMAFIAA